MKFERIPVFALLVTAVVKSIDPVAQRALVLVYLIVIVVVVVVIVIGVLKP